MSDLSVSADLLAPAPTAPGAASARMRETAESFEASFLAQMLKPMFEAEGTWRSFMIDAMSRQAVKAGGIGLADTVVAEMVRMQAQQTQAPAGAAE